MLPPIYTLLLPELVMESPPSKDYNNFQESILQGFKSMQLRMVGPGLVGLGLLLTLLRVLLCIVPPYISRCRWCDGLKFWTDSVRIRSVCLISGLKSLNPFNLILSRRSRQKSGREASSSRKQALVSNGRAVPVNHCFLYDLYISFINS